MLWKGNCQDSPKTLNSLSIAKNKSICQSPEKKCPFNYETQFSFVFFLILVFQCIFVGFLTQTMDFRMDRSRRLIRVGKTSATQLRCIFFAGSWFPMVLEASGHSIHRFRGLEVSEDSNGVLITGHVGTRTTQNQHWNLQSLQYFSLHFVLLSPWR